MLRRLLVSVSAFAVIGTAPMAQAQTYTFFPNDATINYAVPGYGIVGYANQGDYFNGTNPTSPTVNLITGGSVSYLYAYTSSTVNMSGGSVGVFLYAFNSSTVNLSGGSVVRDVIAYDSSLLNIFGTGLTASLIDSGALGGGYSRYFLSGTLLDGTVLTNQNLYIQNGTGARFTLTNVPAPGSLVTALMGIVPGVFVLRRRKSVR